MSGHSHDEHHAAEQKPVAFAVPFYLAVATLLFLFFFLSLCDPKAHHDGGHNAHHAPEAAAAHGAATHEEHAPAEHAVASVVDSIVTDSMAAPEAVPTDEQTAEPAKTAGAQEAHH